MQQRFIVLTLVLTALHAPGMTKVVRHAREDWNDEHATLVIPGEQRESRNPVSRPWIPAPLEDRGQVSPE